MLRILRLRRINGIPQLGICGSGCVFVSPIVLPHLDEIDTKDGELFCGSAGNPDPLTLKIHKFLACASKYEAPRDPEVFRE